MITDRINALFNFIEFLHSNIDNFNNYNDLIRELELLKTEKNKLNPEKNYKDKLKFDEFQAELESKFKILQDNTANPIKAEAKELDVCNFDNEPNYSFNGVEDEIRLLKEGFKNEDLPEIFKHKSQYLEYRNKTHKTYLSLDFFFRNLDRIAKSLFDFFKESAENEFEAFETKTIEVNSIEEAIQILTAKENKDERFWLTTFFDDKEQETLIYKSHQRQIENNGCFTVKMDNDTVKIYTPALAVILTSNELSARNMETQTETTVNGRDYLNTYIEAYKEGEQYFEKEYKVSPNTLYGENAEQYVKDIHLNYFHINHSGTIEGWGYVKKEYPYILTHKVIRDFGYYSGIVNKVEEQVKKYPKQFQTFEICEHQNPPQQNETNLPNIDITQLLEKKEELKLQVERAKEKVTAQEKEILRHKQRAEDGLKNTLAFEQKQIATYESELKSLQREYSNIKIRLKALKHNNNIEKVPQQTETSKPDEVKKEMHLKIFVENAFDIWEQMFESFKINKKKRTDLSFMYEVMLYDKLIHKTVSKKNIEDWINETYLFEIDKIHYTDIKTSANEKRMATYNLLKQSK